MQFKADWKEDIESSAGQLTAADKLIDLIDAEINEGIKKIELLKMKRKFLLDRIIIVKEYTEVGKQLLNVERN